MNEQMSQQILTELQSVNKRFDRLEADFNNRFDRLEADVSILKSEQQAIKQAVLETNESVKRLESIQEQQHRIIELLSARSIEQEAALKRIK